MNKKQFRYKLLRILSAPIDDEFMTHLVDELVAAYHADEIHEKVRIAHERKG